MQQHLRLLSPTVQLVLVGVVGLLSGGWTDGHPQPSRTEGGLDPAKDHRPTDFNLRICGPRIREAISMICTHKAAYAPHSVHERVERDLVPRRPYRAVVDDCCGLGCKISELEKYCGKPIEEEHPRIMSLQDFLRGLVEFFQQTYPQGQQSGEGGFGSHPGVRPWKERTEVREETLETSDEDEDGRVRSGHGRGVKGMNSDETARDKEEEERRSRTSWGKMTSIYSPHLIQVDYHGRGWSGGGMRPSDPIHGKMEEHVSNTGHEIPVVVPQHRNLT